MVTTELPFHKVLNEKEKKKRKAKAKAAVDVLGADISAEKVVREKGVGKEGVRKKRRVHVRTLVHPDSGYVSSSIPLNHAKPLEILTNEEYVSPNVSVGRMGAMRNQTDKHATPPIANVSEFVIGEEGVQENVDATFANEGYGDNKGGLSGLQTQPSPLRHAGQLLETVEKPVRDKVVLKVEAGYFARRFGNLPFTPQLGLTDSSYMDKSHQCRDMMSNLFTSDDNEFFNEGVRDESALEEALKQSKADAHQLRLEKEKYVVEAGNGEMRSLGEAFTLAIGKGFIDGISIGRKDLDIQAILKATPNVNLAFADIFMETYEKLFDKRREALLCRSLFAACMSHSDTLPPPSMVLPTLGTAFPDFLLGWLHYFGRHIHLPSRT
nr:hypothetical protein [Tanacetum cinerariifolium]